MTDQDLISQAEELLRGALILARKSHEPTTINAHCLAVRDGARVVVLQVVRTGRRVGLQAWTEARSGQEGVGRFVLIELQERVDGEEFHTDSGC